MFNQRPKGHGGFMRVLFAIMALCAVLTGCGDNNELQATAAVVKPAKMKVFANCYFEGASAPSMSLEFIRGNKDAAEEMFENLLASPSLGCRIEREIAI